MRPADLSRLSPSAQAQIGPVPRPRRRYPEQQLQIEIVHSILEPMAAAGRIVFFHVPNGFKRTPAEAALAKAMGQRPGVPDLICMVPGLKRQRVFAIEMKAPKTRVYRGGDLSEDQENMHAKFLTCWVPTYVCSSQEQVMAALKTEGVIPL